MKRGLGTRSFLFPAVRGVNVARDVWYDEEGITYATYGQTAKLMAKHMRWYMDQYGLTHIVDATAGLGSNTVAFGQLMTVTAYEVDSMRSVALKRNVDVYNLNKWVTVINETSLSAIRNGGFRDSVMFIDPPWGGKNYKDYRVINDLSMGEIGFLDFLREAIRVYPVVGLKLPTNFSRRALEETCGYMKVAYIRVHRKIRFCIISWPNEEVA